MGTVPVYRDQETGDVVVDPADLPEEEEEEGEEQDGYDDGYEDPDEDDKDPDEDDEELEEPEESVGAEHDIAEDGKPGLFLTLRLLDNRGNAVGHTMVPVRNPDKLWHLAFAIHLHLPMPTVLPKVYASQVQWPFDIDFIRSLRADSGVLSVAERIARTAGPAQSTLPVYYDPSTKEPALVVDLDLEDPDQRAAPSWAREWNRLGSTYLSRYTAAQAKSLQALHESALRTGYATAAQETARKVVATYADPAPGLEPTLAPEPQPKPSPFQATGALALGGAKRAGTMVLATRAISPLRTLVRSLVDRLAPEQRAILDSPAGEVLLDLATPLVLHGLAAHGVLPGGELLQSTAALAYEGHLVHHGMRIADGLVDALTRSPQELAAVRMLAAEVVAKSAAEASTGAGVAPAEPAESAPAPSIKVRAPRKRRVKERAL